MPFSTQEDAEVHNRLHDLILIRQALKMQVAPSRELAVALTHLQSAELFMAEALRLDGVEAVERRARSMAPTIGELEALLNNPNPPDVNINPDGSVTVMPQSSGDPRDYPPLTEEG